MNFAFLDPTHCRLGGGSNLASLCHSGTVRKSRYCPSHRTEKKIFSVFDNILLVRLVSILLQYIGTRLGKKTVTATPIVYYPLEKMLSGWSALYHESCIDPTNQSHILHPPLDPAFPITQITTRLLLKD